jgi:hypothetical protein
MFIAEIFENTAKNTLVIYPGRFQPWHKGHKAVYDSLAKKYGRDSVFITTSNKVELPKSPFSFSDKIQFMLLTGVSVDRVVETRQPYRALELVNKYDASTTQLIFAISEKDMVGDPRFSSWTKKDGSPAYLQPLPKDPSKIETLDRHGYIATVPTVNFTVLGQPMRSATEIRALFAKSAPKQQQSIVKDLFGAYSDEAYNIMRHKLTVLN